LSNLQKKLPGKNATILSQTTAMEPAGLQRVLNREDSTAHKIAYSAVDEKTETRRSR